jgi:hypothetical protein
MTMLLNKKVINSSEKTFTILKVLLLILIFMASIAMLFPYVPEGGKDWPAHFRPAVLKLLSGVSPYGGTFANPPWTLLLLLPLAVLPAKLGTAVLVVASPLIFGMIAYKTGGKMLPVIFFAFSSPVIHNAFNVNIDFLPALGLLMPPQIGLFFILMKPQMALGVGIYWFFEAWQENGFKGVFKVFWPVTAAFLLSFVIYGFWPLHQARNSE